MRCVLMPVLAYASDQGYAHYQYKYETIMVFTSFSNADGVIAHTLTACFHFAQRALCVLEKVKTSSEVACNDTISMGEGGNTP